MTTHTGAPAPGLAPGDREPIWHTLSADGVLHAEKVDEQFGLSSAEAASRAERFGPNKFDAGKAEPRWRAFLRQYTDLMQIVLLAAGVVSLALKEWETSIVLIALTLFNAVLGLQPWRYPSSSCPRSARPCGGMPHRAIKKRGDQDAVRGAFRSRHAAKGNGPPAGAGAHPADAVERRRAAVR